MSTIYVNNKPTDIENIFDIIPGVAWYNATSETIGRPINNVLNEWINSHSTYYYLNGKKYSFELKAVQ